MTLAVVCHANIRYTTDIWILSSRNHSSLARLADLSARWLGLGFDMATILSFFVGILVGAFGVYLLLRKSKTSGGIAAYTDQRSGEKQNRKERIMAALKEKGTVTNDEVEKLLGIADATATKYLQELEREGRIEQIGTQGRFVHYKIRENPSARTS